MYVYVCIYRLQGWKLTDSHCQIRITFGANANHFGQLIRKVFVVTANQFRLVANHFC